MTTFNRRDFVKDAAKSGIVLGAGIGGFAEFARAQGDDDHHFIFVELRGGVQWMIATDGRDLAQLPLDDPNVVSKVKITDEPPTLEEFDIMMNRANIGYYHGNHIILGYLDELETANKAGRTNLDCPYILGFCAHQLAPYVNDMAVVRGVHGMGDFHGLDNAGGEMFSGLRTGQATHVASIMTKLMADKYGAKILDNLVFDNANFTTGASPFKIEPIRIDSQSLGYLVANSQGVTSASIESSFAKAKRLAEAQGASNNLGEIHRQVFNSYIDAMANAPEIRAKLVDELSGDLGQVDASLDLKTQFLTAMTLLEAGLTRVVTLCMGAANGKNKVDGFGLFDCHRGLYHVDVSDPSRANTQRHHLNVAKGMDAIAGIVKKLKSTPYKNTGKTWYDVTTVVITSEFGRPSNLPGNEASGDSTAYGNGHYQWNNNYIFIGKNVRGGAWMGRNEVVTQLGHKVDLASLANDDPNAVITEPVPIQITEWGNPTIDVDYANPTKRPLMARDIVRTVMAIGGVEDRFASAYSEEQMQSAVVIKPVVKG